VLTLSPFATTHAAPEHVDRVMEDSGVKAQGTLLTTHVNARPCRPGSWQ
jgi:hypothetical protein